MKNSSNVPLVLAVEPDLRQGALLKRVIGDGVYAELIVVDSKDAAITALSARVPDVILLTALMSPRDEGEMVAHLRTLEGADHVQTHTIPQLAGAVEREAPAAHARLLGKFRRKKPTQEPIAGCDPALFGEEVRAFLARAAELKAHAAAAPQTRENAKRPGRKRASVPDNAPVATAEAADAEATDGSAWSSPFEWRKAEPLNDTAPKTARPSLVTSAPLAVLAEEQEDRRAREAESEWARAEAMAAERTAADASAAAEKAARHAAESKRLASEAAVKRESERRRLEAEADATQQEERKRLAAEAAAKREEERQRLAADAAAKREEERQRLEAEAAAKCEEERQRLEAETALKREQERQRLEAELAAAREKVRLEAEAAAAREEARLQAVAEAAAECQRIEAEAGAERVRLEAAALAQRVREEAAAREAAIQRERAFDAFADFRADAPTLLTPLSLWARLDERVAPAALRNVDDLRELMDGLALPPYVAGVSYARGCRIRRVRVAAAGAPPKVKGPVIVSKRALDEIRAGQ